MYGRDINRKKLNDNPVVETIYGETVGFTLPFRIKLFEIQFLFNIINRFGNRPLIPFI